MSDHQIILLFTVGVMLGLVMGWLAWRLPMLHAAQRGDELDEDSYTVYRKDVAEAGGDLDCDTQRSG